MESKPKLLGRKFVGLIITSTLVLIGFLLIKPLNISVEHFETFAKWIVIGGVGFDGANAGLGGISRIGEILKEKVRNSK